MRAGAACGKMADMTPREPWTVAVAAPRRDWPARPGCRKGARFLVDAVTLGPAHAGYPLFPDRSAALRWIMAHRAGLARGLAGAEPRPVPLARWMLGLDE